MGINVAIGVASGVLGYLLPICGLSAISSDLEYLLDLLLFEEIAASCGFFLSLIFAGSIGGIIGWGRFKAECDRNITWQHTEVALRAAWAGFLLLLVGLGLGNI